jgi:triosephosphate isomerase
MPGSRRPLIAGNWKMNGLAANGLALASNVAARAAAAGASIACDIAIAPPATLLREVSARLAGGPVLAGGQDCHDAPGGAHTGDLSAAMLKDAGAKFTIVGHSERRGDHDESDNLVRAKAEAALAAGLLTIVCVGETEEERDDGDAVAVVIAQIDGSLPAVASPQSTVVAYEPVWAIGTGRTATLAEIAEIHGAIRGHLAERFGGGEGFRILYGGSVKPGNAAEILALDDVDGALVGGASLNAEDFWAIVTACA